MMRFSVFVRFLLILSALAFLLSAMPGFANAADPDSSSLVFQDWIVNCTRAPLKDGEKPDPKAVAAMICEMVQSFIEKDSQRMVARVEIGRPPGATELKMAVQLPVGVFLPDGVTVAVSGPLSLKAVYTRCAPQVCVAEGDIKKDFLDGVKTVDKLVLTYSDGARRSTTLNVSTKGFAAALAALDSKK